MKRLEKGVCGLMAFIQEDLSTYRQRKLEPESVEAICLDVMDFRNCCFSVCACYRSEIVNKPAEFRSLLNTTWTCLLTKMKEEWKTRHSKICVTTLFIQSNY